MTHQQTLPLNQNVDEYLSLALERSFSQPVFRTTLLTDGDHLRKVLGGAQPPRDGAEAEGYRSGA